MLRRPTLMASRARQRGFIINPFAFGVSGSDPDWASTKLLCHFESSTGTPRAFVNEASANTIENASGTVPDISASQFKFGANSLFYASSGNSRCKSSGGSDYNPLTGDFTEECFIRLGNVATTYLLLDCRSSGTVTTGYAVYMTGTTGVIAFYINGANAITSGNVISANTWHHIAISKASGTSRLFVDGTQVGSNYTDGNNYNSAQVHVIGASFNGSQPAVSSYFDEWRLTIGVGRYTGNFTAPPAAFPNF